MSIVLLTKLLFKQVTTIKIEWDDTVPISISNKWESVPNELKILDQSNTVRQVLCCDELDIDLLGFCDASKVAYETVVYAQSMCEYGIKVSLWNRKCCVANMKIIAAP